METIKLNRTGKRPIVFSGTEIFRGEVIKTEDGKETGKTTALVYETEDGYKVGIGIITYWENERDEYAVTNFSDKERIVTFVKDQIPGIDITLLTDILYPMEESDV